MSSDDNDLGYDLVMPFLPVQSKGGPHDDGAYVAGYEMGQLDVALAAVHGCCPGAVTMGRTIHRSNREQADLIAMRHGFVATFEDYDETWTQMSLNPEGAS